LNPIDAHVKTTRSGKSRGFGIVKFSDAEAVATAVARFDNTDMSGRTVKVRIDQGREKTEATDRRRPQPSNRTRDEEKTGDNGKSSRGGRGGRRGRGAKAGNVTRTERPKKEEGERKPRQPREEKERAPSTNTEGKRVFIGNLPWTTEVDALRTFFTPFGKIEEISVAKTDTGRSKGWGLVTFDSAATANNAVEKLNKTDFEGRNVYVKVDRK